MQIILLILTFLATEVHELHLSMSNITYNDAHHRIEIQQRIFYDDLEKSLRMSLEDDNFDILNPEQSKLNYDSLFQDYYNNRIDIEINGSPIDLLLLEYEINDDALILYLYKSNISNFRSIKIFSHLLFEVYDDQDNVVSVNVMKKRKSKKFSYNSKPLEVFIE